jgi:hypothetical protein
MHQPGYIQGGQEVGRDYLLLGIHYRRIRSALQVRIGIRIQICSSVVPKCDGSGTLVAHHLKVLFRFLGIILVMVPKKRN